MAFTSFFSGAFFSGDFFGTGIAPAAGGGTSRKKKRRPLTYAQALHGKFGLDLKTEEIAAIAPKNAEPEDDDDEIILIALSRLIH